MNPTEPRVYPPSMQSYRWLFTILLLLASNTFMTFAWYYHVKKAAWGLLAAILISWLIALPEYILQVPANRLGAASSLSLSQLKIMQEGITLAVFTLFAVLIAKQAPTWRDAVAMGLVLAAVAVSFSGRSPSTPAPNANGTPSPDAPAGVTR